MMRILHQDAKANRLKLRIETLDDLWYLRNIVEAGDVTHALTTRRDEAATDKLRSERGEKKRMVLGVGVEKVEFHEFSDRLRILGVIEEGPQDIGSHHTLNIEVGDDITITKPEWRDHHLEQVKEAVESTKRPLVTILSMEDGDATLGLLREYGIQEMAHVTAQLSGKQYASPKNAKREFFAEVLRALDQMRAAGTPLVMVGPGFAKEEFLAYLKDASPGHTEDCHLYGTGQAGMVGIHEVMKKGIASGVLADSRVARETGLVERLFMEIQKDGAFAYGEEDVQGALARGAVETLLVTDLLLRERKADRTLEMAKEAGAELVVVSTSHDAGKKLQGIGGVGALCRYRLHA